MIKKGYNYQLTSEDVTLDLRKTSDHKNMVHFNDGHIHRVLTKANTEVYFSGNVKELLHVSGASVQHLQNLQASKYKHTPELRERKGSPSINAFNCNIVDITSYYKEPINIFKTFCGHIMCDKAAVQLSEAIVNQINCESLSLTSSIVSTVLYCKTMKVLQDSPAAPLCGPFYLWKKATFIISDCSISKALVLLHVPAKAHRFGTSKIRVSHAYVKGFYSVETLINKQKLERLDLDLAYSLRDTAFEYRLNKIVKPKPKYDKSPISCTSGIHGFLNPLDAAKHF